VDSRILSPAHCAIARKLLGWGIRELALQAQVSHATIVSFERGQRSPHASTRSMILQALEAGGVEIIKSDAINAGAKMVSVTLDDGSVVRLKS
jgi:predicted transcriptional regulator